MNRRTGPLTVSDLDRAIAAKVDNCADSLPFPHPTEPPHIGADFSAPPPRRMWQEEIDDPRLIRLYGWTFTAAIVASALFTRCSP